MTKRPFARTSPLRRRLSRCPSAVVIAAVLAGVASACGSAAPSVPAGQGGAGASDGAAATSGGAGSSGAAGSSGGAGSSGAGGGGRSGAAGSAAGNAGKTGGAGAPARDAGLEMPDATTIAEAGGDATGTDAGGSGTGVIAAGVRWVGRVDLASPDRPRFSWSGTGFVARFSGTSLSMHVNDTGAFIFKPVVDGTPKPAFTVAAGDQTATIATGLSAGVHTIEVYRQTEGSQGDSQLLAVAVGGGTLMDPPAPPSRLIEVVGDSISCGYGTLGTLADSDCFPTESPWDTYGAVAARALGADVHTIAMSGQGVVRNYGGDTNNTLPMVYTRALTNDATPAWDFRTQAQAVIVNLGTNDISNGKGDPGAAFETAYVGLLQNIRAHHPGAFIICLVAPLLGGADLTTMQAHIAAAVAKRAAAGDHDVEAFDKIAGQTSDKAACQYHPNPAENQLMANQIVAELRAKLGW